MVIAGSNSCAVRSAPVTCLIVERIATIATKLSIADAVTIATITGALPSSSMNREQTCPAVKLDGDGGPQTGMSGEKFLHD
jgi:hypothetical protein